MCSYFHPLLRYYIPGNESTQPHSVRTSQAYQNSIYYLLFLSGACHPLISMSLSYLPQKHYTSAETRHPPISFIITISLMIMQFNTAHVYIYFNQLLRFLFFDRATTHTFSGAQVPDPSVPHDLPIHSFSYTKFYKIRS